MNECKQMTQSFCLVGVAEAYRDLAPAVAVDIYWSGAQERRRKERSAEEGGESADEGGGGIDWWGNGDIGESLVSGMLWHTNVEAR